MRYAIAILKQAYQPDVQGIEQVQFASNGNGDTVYYDDVEQATERVAELDSERHVTANNESGRPEYYIVDDVTADYVATGRNGDMSNYNWDDCNCERMASGGDACGECSACMAMMIEQDREYIRDYKEA